MSQSILKQYSQKISLISSLVQFQMESAQYIRTTNLSKCRRFSVSHKVQSHRMILVHRMEVNLYTLEEQSTQQQIVYWVRKVSMKNSTIRESQRKIYKPFTKRTLLLSTPIMKAWLYHDYRFFYLHSFGYLFKSI